MTIIIIQYFLILKNILNLQMKGNPKENHHLLPLAILFDNPLDDVSVHLCEYERRVVLYVQISLLDGRHWTRTTAKLT